MSDSLVKESVRVLISTSPPLPTAPEFTAVDMELLRSRATSSASGIVILPAFPVPAVLASICE